AVPSHCYDPSTIIRSIGTADSSTPNIYAHYWLSNSPAYFTDVEGAANYVNFYNESDYALGKWQVNQNLKPDNSLGYNFSFDSSGARFSKSGRELTFPLDTYELFAFCIEARCYALGAQEGVAGKFVWVNQVNL